MDSNTQTVSPLRQRMIDDRRLGRGPSTRMLRVRRRLDGWGYGAMLMLCRLGSGGIGYRFLAANSDTPRENHLGQTTSIRFCIIL